MSSVRREGGRECGGGVEVGSVSASGSTIDFCLAGAIDFWHPLPGLWRGGRGLSDTLCEINPYSRIDVLRMDEEGSEEGWEEEGVSEEGGVPVPPPD